LIRAHFHREVTPGNWSGPDSGFRCFGNEPKKCQRFVRSFGLSVLFSIFIGITRGILFAPAKSQSFLRSEERIEFTMINFYSLGRFFQNLAAFDGVTPAEAQIVGENAPRVESLAFFGFTKVEIQIYLRHPRAF
jgi:hypothetical protein